MTPSYFENIRVLAYGEKRPLSELVQFVPKSANTMALNAFDENMVTEIIKVSYKKVYILKF